MEAGAYECNVTPIDSRLYIIQVHTTIVMLKTKQQIKFSGTWTVIKGLFLKDQVRFIQVVKRWMMHEFS